MSEFLRRWSQRKLHPIAPEPEPVAPAEPVSPDSGMAARVSGIDALPEHAEPAVPSLPDKETLRALFRQHKPDGLDDYTQDFAAPELLSAELVAGLRGWLVEPVEEEQSEKAEIVAHDPDEDGDILVSVVGQNVAFDEGDEERNGS
ncbi:DUF3306 domain-containing protein [Aeromonas simiae]|uniref:DUF3306 domain-containing protein n=1 Tax=Aeromonas simiae TaxID=218936 RepID=A0A5J6WVB9_9GAMM|nr:DUF3306 domain-containing protein [Aeromonas simiae]QFI54151.1 DUF3306 domain-containing protein [Aeromonas simiae]